MKTILTNEYEILLRRLISARKADGLTQQELASRLDKPQSFVSKYERRERRLDVFELVVICRALGLDACSIIREIEDRLPTGSNPKTRAAP